jgi:hypothetical protein
LRQQRDQLVELLAAADEVAHRHGHRPRSPVLFTAGSSRLREEPLAQQQSEVGGKQVLELVSSPESLVRDVARRSHDVEHRHQPRFAIRCRRLQIHQAGHSRGVPQLVLEPRDVHPRRDPAVPLPVQPDEDGLCRR